MNSPHIRERLATTVLAGPIIATAILAIPSRSSTQPPAPAATASAEPADEDHPWVLRAHRAVRPAAPAELTSPELAEPVYDRPWSPERLNHAADAATRFAVASRVWCKSGDRRLLRAA